MVGEEQRPLPRDVELSERIRQVRLEFIEQPEEAGAAWKQGYEVGSGPGGRRVTERVPIAACVDCGRWAEDPTRDVFDNPMPDHEFSNEAQKQALCVECLNEKLEELAEEETVRLLESKLGLSEQDRQVLRSFTEAIFTDPEKILKVEKTENRVTSLEKTVGYLWVALGITGGLIGVLLAAVIGIALALAS